MLLMNLIAASFGHKTCRRHDYLREKVPRWVYCHRANRVTCTGLPPNDSNLLGDCDGSMLVPLISMAPIDIDYAMTEPTRALRTYHEQSDVNWSIAVMCVARLCLVHTGMLSAW
jgi:hypothetical protein